MTPQTQQRVRDFSTALRSVGGAATVVRNGTAAAAAIEEAMGRGDGPRTVLYEPSPIGDRLGLVLALRARGLDPRPAASAGAGIDAVRVGVTGAALAVAESGSLLIGGHPGGWGLTTILPWVHIALLDPADVVPDLTTAFGRFHARFQAGERNWVWVTGPSKTADIAKTLVMGIHGPNQLRVLIVDDAHAAAASR